MLLTGRGGGCMCVKMKLTTYIYSVYVIMVFSLHSLSKLVNDKSGQHSHYQSDNKTKYLSLLLTYSDVPQESVDKGQLKVSNTKLHIIVQFLATRVTLGLLGTVPKLLDLLDTRIIYFAVAVNLMKIIESDSFI